MGREWILRIRRIDRLEQRLDGRIDRLEQRLDRRIDELESRVSKLFEHPTMGVGAMGKGGDFGEVQRRERDDHVEHRDADRDEGPRGRHHGQDRRDDCWRNGYQLHRDRPVPRSQYLPAAQ